MPLAGLFVALAFLGGSELEKAAAKAVGKPIEAAIKVFGEPYDFSMNQDGVTYSWPREAEIGGKRVKCQLVLQVNGKKKVVDQRFKGDVRACAALTPQAAS